METFWYPFLLFTFVKSNIIKLNSILKKESNHVNKLYFYKDAGSDFIVVHKTTENGKVVRLACGQNEHGLDIEVREDHDLDSIRKELEAMVGSMDFADWTAFADEEEEMELTHFETCMGPVEKAYAFVIEWK